MLILHSSSYIYTDKYNVIWTCNGWITVCFFPPIVHLLVSYCSILINCYPSLLLDMTYAVLFFYTVAIAMSYFHTFMYYFERRWVPITNVQCILQMIKFNRPLKQKYDSILFHWLRGFGMVDYKTLHERYYNWSSFSHNFLHWYLNTLYSWQHNQ